MTKNIASSPAITPGEIHSDISFMYRHPKLLSNQEYRLDPASAIDLPQVPGLPILEAGGTPLPFDRLRVKGHAYRPIKQIVFDTAANDGRSAPQPRLEMHVFRAETHGPKRHAGSLLLKELVVPEGIVVPEGQPLQVTYPPEFNGGPERINGFTEVGQALGSVCLTVTDWLSKHHKELVSPSPI
jgi:hypothetical protein